MSNTETNQRPNIVLTVEKYPRTAVTQGQAHISDPREKQLLP